MNWMLEKCGSLAVLVSFRTTRPFDASAMKMSTDSSDRVEMNEGDAFVIETPGGGGYGAPG